MEILATQYNLHQASKIHNQPFIWEMSLNSHLTSLTQNGECDKVATEFPIPSIIAFLYILHANKRLYLIPSLNALIINNNRTGKNRMTRRWKLELSPGHYNHHLFSTQSIRSYNVVPRHWLLGHFWGLRLRSSSLNIQIQSTFLFLMPVFKLLKWNTLFNVPLSGARGFLFAPTFLCPFS